MCIYYIWICINKSADTNQEKSSSYSFKPRSVFTHHFLQRGLNRHVGEGTDAYFAHHRAYYAGNTLDTNNKHPSVGRILSFSLKTDLFLFYGYESFSCMCIYIPHALLMPTKARRENGSLGPGVAESVNYSDSAGN